MLSSESFAFIFFVSMILTTFGFEIFYVLEQIYPSTQVSHFLLNKWFHYTAAVFILHQVLGSLVKLILVDSSIRGVVLSSGGSGSSAKQSTKYCTVCECYIPDRAFHCRDCGICILKRTHHCLFAKRCVGYKNFRYFLSLLLYVCIGCLYASILNQSIVWKMLGGFSCKNFFAHCFPFLFWLFGSLNFSSMAICMLSVIHVCGFLFTFGLLIYHGNLLLHNQTVFERGQGRQDYDLGSALINVRESLGSQWYLIWISPCIDSQLPRDGIQFPTTAEYRLQSAKSK